jgi:hypothetical protein
MKILTYIAVFVLGSSCSRNIIGTFRHNICCSGPNCYILTIQKNNKFEYEYWTDILGSGKIYGDYTRHFNKLSLKPILPLEFQIQKPGVQSIIDKSADSTNLHFYSLPAIITKFNDSLYKSFNFQDYKLNITDTIKSYYVIFNLNKISHLPDTNGVSKVRLKIDDTISIQDPLRTIIPFVYTVKESSIKELNLFIPEQPYIEPIFDFMTREFKIRKNGLYPLTYEPEMALFGNYSFFNKFRCLEDKERVAIRDTLFKLINQNISRKVFDSKNSDDDFIVSFNKKGTVKKVVFTPVGESKFKEWSYNFLGIKERRNIKKAIRNYKVPDFNEIKYDFSIRITVFYDSKTDELILN